MIAISLLVTTCPVRLHPGPVIETANKKPRTSKTIHDTYTLENFVICRKHMSSQSVYVTHLFDIHSIVFIDAKLKKYVSRVKIAMKHSVKFIFHSIRTFSTQVGNSPLKMVCFPLEMVGSPLKMIDFPRTTFRSIRQCK